MTVLKERIDFYMKKNQIKKYSDLLRNIAYKLGKKGEEAYEFARNEKYNFSKMLKGERPLKNEYIIPLEKIFGISIARLLYEDEYIFPVEKDNIPFDKGFRYYAMLDDIDVYEKEFDTLLDINGKTIMVNTDEYGKTFLDYIVEYGSTNGVKYLYDHYNPKIKWYHNELELCNIKGHMWMHREMSLPFARLVASMNDVNMFYSIFDSYNMFFTNGHYGRSFGADSCIFYQEEFLKIIMEDDDLFNELFKEREYTLEGSKKNDNVEYKTYISVNPILNLCLKYSIEHLDKYRKQAIAILNFGIIHNNEIANEYSERVLYIASELGVLFDTQNRAYYGLAILPPKDIVDDGEIKELIQKLPTFLNPNKY